MSFVSTNLAVIQSSLKRQRKGRLDNWRSDDEESTNDKSSIRQVSAALDVLLNFKESTSRNIYHDINSSSQIGCVENKGSLFDDAAYVVEKLVYRASAAAKYKARGDQRCSNNGISEHQFDDYHDGCSLDLVRNYGFANGSKINHFGYFDSLKLGSNFIDNSVEPTESDGNIDTSPSSSSDPSTDRNERIRFLSAHLMGLRGSNKREGGEICDVIRFLFSMSELEYNKKDEQQLREARETSVYFGKISHLFKPSNFLKQQKSLLVMLSPRSVLSLDSSSFCPQRLGISSVQNDGSRDMDKKRIWSSAKNIVLKSGHTQEAHYSIDDVQKEIAHHRRRSSLQMQAVYERRSLHHTIEAACWALAGYPSNMFKIIPNDKKYSLVYVNGLPHGAQSQALIQILTQIAETGSTVRFLREVVTSIRSEQNTKNLALARALAYKVSNTLEHLCSEIMKLSHFKSLFMLHHKSRDYIEKISFLYNICTSLFLGEKPVASILMIEKCYEYRAYSNPMMRNETQIIFTTATKKLFSSISLWIFYGLALESSFLSVLMKSNDDLLLSCVRCLEEDDCFEIETLRRELPSFLSLCAKDIYRCGCILSLLRVSNEKLYQCCISRIDQAEKEYFDKEYMESVLSLRWTRKSIALYCRNLENAKNSQYFHARNFILTELPTFSDGIRNKNDAKLIEEQNIEIKVTKDAIPVTIVDHDSSVNISVTNCSTKVSGGSSEHHKTAGDSKELQDDQSCPLEASKSQYENNHTELCVDRSKNALQGGDDLSSNQRMHEIIEQVMYERYDDLMKDAEYRSRVSSWKIGQLERIDLGKDELIQLYEEDESIHNKMRQEGRIISMHHKLSTSSPREEIHEDVTLEFETQEKNFHITSKINVSAEVNSKFSLEPCQSLESNILLDDAQQSHELQVAMPATSNISEISDVIPIENPHTHNEEDTTMNDQSCVMPVQKVHDRSDCNFVNIHDVSEREDDDEDNTIHENVECFIRNFPSDIYNAAFKASVDDMKVEEKLSFNVPEVLPKFCSKETDTFQGILSNDLSNDDDLSLDYILKKCILCQISSQLIHIQRISYIYFIEGTGLIQHLDFLRRIMLGKGCYLSMFAQHVGSNINNDTAYVDWNCVANVMSFHRNCLSIAGLGNSLYSQYFTYETRKLRITSTESFYDINPDSLKFIRGVYSPPPPISFLIGATLNEYNKIQVFLIRHFHMKNRVNDICAHILKSEYFDQISTDIDQHQLSRIRWIHSFRFKFQHVVGSISNYLTLKLTEAETKFMKVVTNFESSELLSFNSFHRNYLEVLLLVTFQSSDIHSQEVKSCLEFLNVFVMELMELVFSFEKISEVGFNLLLEQKQQFYSIVEELTKALGNVNMEHSNELILMLS